MNKISYFLKEGFKNIWVNWVMSLVTISVLSLCLLLLGTSLIVSFNVKNLISQVEGTNQIAVFLNAGLDQKAIDAVGEKIKSISNVNKIVFISSKEALEIQKKQLGEYKDLVSGLENDNYLPNAYQVSLKSMAKYSDTVKQLGSIEGVKKTTQNIDIANKLTQISNVIGVVGIWLFAILAVVSLFIVSNTIKSAVYVRKREINIMKFVGATDGFIRWPFVVEGLFIGIISSIVAVGAEYYIYIGLISKAFNVLKIINPIPITNFSGYMIAGFLISGILVGICGSLISIRKYLRV